jgi:hypothetical protein
MKQSLASLTDAVLRNNTAGASAHHSLGEDGSPTEQPMCRSNDSQIGSSSSTIPIAPIQAVRNMNSWITGQRPDGKQDRPIPPTATIEAAVDEKYIRV